MEWKRVELRDDFEDFAIRWARGLEDALMRGNFIRPSALRSPGGGGSGAASPTGRIRDRKQPNHAVVFCSLLYEYEVSGFATGTV